MGAPDRWVADSALLLGRRPGGVSLDFQFPQKSGALRAPADRPVDGDRSGFLLFHADLQQPDHHIVDDVCFEGSGILHHDAPVDAGDLLVEIHRDDDLFLLGVCGEKIYLAADISPVALIKVEHFLKADIA